MNAVVSKGYVLYIVMYLVLVPRERPCQVKVVSGNDEKK